MKIIIFGAGGHAKVVCEVIEAIGGLTIAGFTAPDPVNTTFLGYPLFDEAIFLNGNTLFDAAVVAVGDNLLRRSIARRLQDARPAISFPALVHPSALVSPRAVLGKGTVVMARAVIHAGAATGPFVIINTGAILEHDSSLGAGVHLAPGSIVGGGCTIGDDVLIGIGAAVRPRVRICNGCLVGAGAAVVRDLALTVTVAGVPAIQLMPSR